MQIGNQVGHGYETNIQERNKTEYVKTTEPIRNTQSLSQPQGLKEGTVFKGEVLNIAGDKITISLEDKAQLFARLQEGVELDIGDRLFFSVKENNSNQILIKPLFDSLQSAKTQVLERALDAAGLSPTEKNFSVAKELMDAGMPVDKGNMVKLLSQSLKFEGTSLQTLVGLNKMQIPVNEANITQYERYQGHRHQLTNDIHTVANQIVSFTQAFPEGVSGSEMLSIANQIAEIFLPNENIDVEQMNLVNRNATNEQMAPQEHNIRDLNIEIAPNKVSSEIIPSTEQTMILMPDQENNPNIITTVSDKNRIENTDANKILTADGKQLPVEQESINTVNESVFEAQENTITKETITKLTDMLNQAGMSKGNIQSVVRNVDSTEVLLKNLLQQLTTSAENTIKQTLNSNEFKALFEDVIKKRWSIQPKNMQDPKEIDELYERIVKQSRDFENIIATNGGESGKFEQNFQNMRQNLQFMEQLNQQMIYAQMPLKLSNQNANSELYVYADKRKLAQKKDGISVMLHLDMDSLGQTDIHVTLTGTNVNARFYLNDQESVTIVSENMNRLAKQLAERGFSLTNEVIQRQPRESINKVIDEVIDENAERSIKRYTFDART